MARVVSALVALVATWLSFQQPCTAATTSTAAEASYAYSSPHVPIAQTTDHYDRGPPAAYNRPSAYDAVTRWPRAASTRPEGPTHPGETIDNDLAKSVQGVQVTGTTAEPAGRTGWDLSSVPRAGVAANTAAKACSFGGSTVVLMADGTKKPIEEIEIGDEVVATDPQTGEQVATQVEHVFVHDDTVSDLLLDGEVISTTEDHPFWSVTDQRFERADELSPGEKVLGADGREVTVSGLELKTASEGLAYNLSIEGIHTYHVGDAKILVHNTCLTALREWSSRRFQFGNAQFQLDKSGLSHILKRHHPNYWDGTVKARQTFFDSSMSIADVEDAIGAVARQNRDQLVNIGAGTGQIQGRVNGIDYVLGVSGGRIGQFYPGVLQ